MKKLFIYIILTFVSQNVIAQGQKHTTKTKVVSNQKKASPKVIVPPIPQVKPVDAAKDSIFKMEIVIKADEVNPNFKGPYGETIYTDSSCKLYYIDKNDKHIYIDLSD